MLFGFSTILFKPHSLVFAKHHSYYCMVMDIVCNYSHGPIEENKSFLKLSVTERQIILLFCYVKLFQDRTSRQYLQFPMLQIC